MPDIGSWRCPSDQHYVKSSQIEEAVLPLHCLDKRLYNMETHYEELGSSNFISQESSTFCRLCANSHEYFIQIYSEEGKTHSLADKINRHLPITVSDADTLPTQLCYQCASTLLAYHELIDTCLSAEKRLEYLLNYQTDKVELNLVRNNDTQFQGQSTQAENGNFQEHETRIGISPNCAITTDFPPALTSHEPSSVQEESVGQRERDSLDNLADNDKPEKEIEEETDDGETIKKKRKKKDTISKCLICGRVFQFVEYLRTHLLSHSENRPHLCHICGASFKRKDHVNHHRKTVHMNHPDVLRELEERGKGHLTCDECGEVKPTKHLLVIHKRKHLISSRCDICDEVFNLPSLLKEHMVKLHSTIQVACSFCGEEMKSGRELFLHKQKHFTSFICDVCGKSFAQQSSLRTHMVIHSDEKPYSCDECGKSFKLKVRLQLHKQSHTDIRPYACTLCKDKRFKTRTALVVHINMHNDTRPYPCPHCSFRARKNSDLVCHIRTHTGEKPYKCEVCGRGFAQAGDMRKHRSTHDRQKSDSAKF